MKAASSIYVKAAYRCLILLPIILNTAGRFFKYKRYIEQIRTKIKAIKFVEADKEFFVTVSIGVVKYENKLKIKNLIELADKALYKAKQEGRDRIFLRKYQQEFDF